MAFVTPVVYWLVGGPGSGDPEIVSDSTPSPDAELTLASSPVQTAPVDTIESIVWLQPEPAFVPVIESAPIAASPTPGPRLVRRSVGEGESLSTIAAQFGLRTETLVWANQLASPDDLAVGAELTIPPADGVLHVVETGDSISELASRFGASSGDIVEANHLPPPYYIVIGDPLFIPGGRPPEPPAPAQPVAGPPAAPAPTPAPADLAALTTTDGAPAERRFIERGGEAARASQRETGVPASVTLAQAILESDWGTSRLAYENANFFGIKARERPGTAGVVWYDTWEVVNGRNVVLREPFRAYRTMADSFVDHGRFFLENPRYLSALAARGNAREFARRINAAGYATDPNYAEKLIRLMDRFNLYAYDLR